jgi:hypothetical protein
VKYQGGELVTDIAVAIGKALGSSDVTDVLNSLAPVRVVEDPPFRTYIGSPKKGVDLLFENDRVVSIQIYTQATRTFSPFRGTLPLGLMMSMKQPGARIAGCSGTIEQRFQQISAHGFERCTGPHLR